MRRRVQLPKLGRRRAAAILLTLAVTLLLASFCIAALLGEAAVHPRRFRRLSDAAALARGVAFASNARVEQVVIRAPDGTSLSAWWLEPVSPSGRAIIVCHGVADSSLGVLGDAALFLRQGYSVLVPDSRGHGASGGLTSYGVQESDDIVLWLSWIRQRGASAVFGFGESLGGAILLQSLARNGAAFRAIIAECPFAGFREVAIDRVEQFGGLAAPPLHWIARLLVAEGIFYVRLRHSVDLADADSKSAVALTHVPVLLIHGLDDRETLPKHSIEIVAANPDAAALWLVPGASHTGAYAARPTEFEHRVIAFLTSH